MADSAETRQRRDVLIELFEIGVLDRQELDAKMVRLGKPEPEERSTQLQLVHRGIVARTSVRAISSRHPKRPELLSRRAWR
jgi:hypothetical protein